jgi:ATP-dependent helicase Lhr and Lhr-like helicase
VATAVDELLSPATAAWFADAFPDGPTPAQVGGWPPIAAGRHVLLCAPTGSGKTLAAFLVGLDRLAATPAAERGVRLLYVSPLKALNYDVERNLRGPLAGIRAAADRLGLARPEVSVAVRTGDTPAAERQAMLRRPPDILITTPESLFLILTSPNAREILRTVEAVIVDEVHAVAATKRGSHLALTLERLDALCEREVQRIALSATQRPLEEIARFVGGDREVEIVDAGMRKQLELEIVVPVEDMTELPAASDQPDQWGDPAANRTIWPAVYPRLLELVREHATTLVFVNYRRLAERLALRLNELAGEEVARAHHGSLAREARTQIEEALKRGELRCLVATSSLELGIDMGSVDLVVQVESPKSVARGLQRIGRAGHQVGAPSRGRIFPKFRGDLLECAVVAGRMRTGEIEETRVPRNALDVVAQQVVAACATEEWTVDALYDLVRRAHPYRELPRSQFEGVLDMLAGRYPSDDFAELRPRIVWDRIAGVVRGRENARPLAVANAGTIPDRGLYGVFLADGSGRVGELDEEMVYEARVGQTFLLGASAWRIERITRDRVLVSPAPGAPGQIPFWRGEGVGRPVELGRALGRFTRELAAEREPAAIARLREHHDLDERAARNLLQYLRDQRDATGVLPSDRTIVVERFRDEIGDWRLCLLSPFGGQVHAPWAMALGAVLRDRVGMDTQALWSDDGIILHLPDADEPPAADVVALDADEVEDLVVRELAASALYGARFRENAARALLIPRRRPGQRTPLWQQRLKAQSLLAATEGYGSFPIVLETYRECLEDVFDLPGLRALLRGIERREIALVEAETPYGSPFASSLLFDYIAQYMYEGDAPPAERRAQALSLDRELLRELLGSDELRDLLDADAIAEVVAALRRPGNGPDGLHDLLRRVGDLPLGEVDAGLAETLRRERRATILRIAGEERLVAAEDAGRYRDGVGALPPPGLPDVFLEPVPHALRGLVARFARGRGPFAAEDATAWFGVPLQRVLDDLHALEREGVVVQGELTPGGRGREWCDAEVLRRIRRASLARLRAEVEAVGPETLARFAPRWQRVDEAGRGGTERLREALVGLQGLPLPVTILERQVLARRVPAYRPDLLDALCAAGEVVWCGAGEGRAALYFRDEAPLLGPPAALPPPDAPLHHALRERLAAGPCFFTELCVATDAPAGEVAAALWALVWAGEATNDAYAPLRAPRALRDAVRAPAPPPPRGRRIRRRPTASAPAIAGRWTLAAPLFDGASETDRARARAEILLERHGVVTRSTVRGEAIPGGFGGLYPELLALETLGAARRGYFVEGLGGAQFALPGAVERLRDLREAPREPEAVVLAAADPANPYGAALPWPALAAGRASRSAGAFVVTVDGRAALFVERGGKSLLPLVGADDPALPLAVDALAAAGDLVGRLAVERVAGEPVAGSELEERLLAAGFRRGPRRLTLG